MAPRARSDAWVWVISGTVALVVALGAVFLVEPARKQAPPQARPGGGLGVQRMEGNKLLVEQAQLRDPMALFLPVERNSDASGNSLVGAAFAPGQELARSFQGKLAYADESAAVDFPLRTPVPERPADAIGLGDPELPFLGMGRKDRAVSPLPVRSAYIQVTESGTGKMFIDEPIRDAKVPSANDWQPLEMLVLIDRAGLVAPPTVSRSSTADGVDDFFRSYLENGLHLGERLGPGSYVVTVGR